MYKIKSITDKDGNVKQEQIDRIISIYGSLDGDIYYKQRIMVGGNLCFIYANQDNKMMITSIIESISEYDNIYKVETRNSVYEFEVI